MSERQPFNKIVEDRTLTFCRGLLTEVPELEGVAVVPSYTVPQPNMPFGFVIGRQGPLRSPAEVMHMSMQLYATLEHVMQTMLTLLKSYDAAMAAMAKETQLLIAAREKVEQADADTGTSNRPG